MDEKEIRELLGLGARDPLPSVVVAAMITADAILHHADRIADPGRSLARSINGDSDDIPDAHRPESLAHVLEASLVTLARNVRRIAEGENSPSGLEGLAMSINGEGGPMKAPLSDSIGDVAAALREIAERLPERE